MAMRAVKLLGENRAPVLVTVRHFTASRNLWVAGAPGSGTEGTKDMDSGERESESLESPHDVKQPEDDGKTDRDEEELQGKPVVQVGIEKVSTGFVSYEGLRRDLEARIGVIKASGISKKR